MLLLATILASVATTLAEDITVTLNKGKLRGARLDYDFGQYYYAFKGIPYARPPVKELRFKVKNPFFCHCCLFISHSCVIYNEQLFCQSMNNHCDKIY